MSADLISQLESLVQAAEQDLQAVSAGQPLCSFDKNSFDQSGLAGSVKFQEGRYYALKTALRHAQRDAAGCSELLQQALQRAEQFHQRYEQAQSGAWMAYYQGEMRGYVAALGVF